MALILQRSRWLSILLGFGLGAVILLFAFAWAGSVLSVVLGITVGCLAGLLPYEIVRHSILLSLGWSKTTRLKEHLDRDPGLSDFIISELVRRGERAEQFRDYVQSLLQSGSNSRRKLGERIRRRCSTL